MKRLFTLFSILLFSFGAFSQTISWAYIQWAASTTINQGQAFEAGAACFADGLTNAVNSTNGEGITCDLGYSSTNNDPSSQGWTWTPIAFNSDWGNNFYYQGTVSGITAGTYYYTFRFKSGADNYKYAGTNGLWNGSSSVSGTFTVNPAPAHITWAYLQWAASTTINQSQAFEAGAVAFADGLTNAVTSTTGEGMTCDLGYSSTNNDPSSTGWTWTPVAFNSDWGNNFYFQGSVSGIPSGTYYYNFRFKLGSDTYKYAGTDGLWNGTTSVNGSLNVTATTAINDISADGTVVLVQNPVKNGIAQIKLNNQPEGLYMARVYDCAGRMILAREFENSDSNSLFEISLIYYSKGIYNLQLVSPDSKKVFIRIINE